MQWQTGGGERGARRSRSDAQKAASDDLFSVYNVRLFLLGGRQLKRMAKLLLIALVLVFLIVFIYTQHGGVNCSMVAAGGDSCPNNYLSPNDNGVQGKAHKDVKPTMRPETIHLAVVACGDRLEETLMMLKSAVSLCTSPFRAHVFADKSLQPMFEQSLSLWKDVIGWLDFDYTIYDVTFPQGNAEAWRSLFKPCACQRLFIPDLLTTTDSLIYVDTDVLFMSAPELLWNHFHSFNNDQISALAPESEDRQTNWYVRFAMHPFYEPLGVNSGVMLMNLTRMRTFKWGNHLWPLYLKYRRNITWGDQDIINIIFHDHHEKLYVYGCEWNFRPDHCMYMSTCKMAEDEGVMVLHGSRGFFHKDKQPAFKIVYEQFKKFQLGSNLLENLVEPLEKRFEKLKHETNTNCAKIWPVFTNQLRRFTEKPKTK